MEYRLVLLFMFLTFGGVLSVNPGLKLRISQQGLDYAASQAVRVLSAKVPGQRIPDQHGSSGHVSYDITGTSITSFTPPSGHVTTQPGQGVTLSIQNVGLSVHGDWHYHYRHHFIKVSDHGNFDVTVSGASISVGVTLGIDSVTSGRPTIRATSCSSNVDHLSVKIHGGASWFYNIFNDKIAKALKGALSPMLCRAAQSAINDDGTQALTKMNVQVSLGDLAVLDYRLTTAPVFGNPYIETSHKGEVFWKGDFTEAPFSAAPLPDPVQTPHMVSIWISDYLVNTMGYVAHKNNLLVHTLTADDLPAENKGVLNTTCTGLVCLGNVIPGLAQQYPNCTMEVKMRTTHAPELKVTPADLQGRFNGTMEFYVVTKNGTKPLILTAYINASVSLTMRIQGDKVVGTVTDIRPNIHVPNPSFPVQGLNFFFRVAANGYIKPKMNELANQGFELPNIPGLHFINPSITLAQGAVSLMTDVKYDPSRL